MNAKEVQKIILIAYNNFISIVQCLKKPRLNRFSEYQTQARLGYVEHFNMCLNTFFKGNHSSVGNSMVNRYELNDIRVQMLLALRLK